MADRGITIAQMRGVSAANMIRMLRGLQGLYVKEEDLPKKGLDPDVFKQFFGEGD